MTKDAAHRDPLYGEAVRAVAAADSIHALNLVKAAYLGRNGSLQSRLRGIGDLPKEQRAAAGIANNAVRAALETLFESRKDDLIQAQANVRARRERLDVTMPGRVAEEAGVAHPLHQTMERAAAILSTIGFETATGPEIETDYYNFEALNFPPDHPARDMHDTLYVNCLCYERRVKKEAWLLRTHTSSVQIRHMENMLKREEKPPVRVISTGRVYRRDNDATHSPMFHQIEGLWVDDAVRFTDLKGVLGAFFRTFFNDDQLALRFRPSYFPFTEPSAECDIRRHDGEWLEVAGCGMVHPNVLKKVGIDSEKYRGFAFGMGVERLAMLYHGIKDIRLFFENDMRFLTQFRR